MGVLAREMWRSHSTAGFCNLAIGVMHRAGHIVFGNKSGAKDAQGALKDCDESLRIEPGNVFALGTRADVKRLLGDHKVSLRTCSALAVIHHVRRL